MNFRLAYSIPLVFLLILISGCEKTEKQWQFERKIMLPKEVRPLAVAKDGNSIWFSDPDYFRLYKIDGDGKVLDSITGIQRPMNIHFDNDTLFIPEFLTDTIWQYKMGKIDDLKINERPQAPAGISVYGDTVLVADFYNHRIIVQTPNESFTIGKQGHKDGELYYPIDVKMKDEKIYVADAYNNRVQVFGFDGEHQKTIGQTEKINVASGIALGEGEFAITDQENSRVLIYNCDGILVQILTENINYPTDVLFDNNCLYIANFKENSVVVYQLN
ncbi:NHL repeat-containing protein [Cytophaga sp. FL35]|uniref:NHL repeat-containing protein n=1 Tax=Cytophaga sp. FL35 TaxID=1904456 RepID=UPI001653AFE0|nr:NHL repeat-containing protein [Cytophaga sp. FL35]MBC6999596.1 NHL repeat-containing protein [Cytophaga sp. FL35]